MQDLKQVNIACPDVSIPSLSPLYYSLGRDENRTGTVKEGRNSKRGTGQIESRLPIRCLSCSSTRQREVHLFLVSTTRPSMLHSSVSRRFGSDSTQRSPNSRNLNPPDLLDIQHFYAFVLIRSAQDRPDRPPKALFANLCASSGQHQHR
jgi:hypothetical protein